MTEEKEKKYIDFEPIDEPWSKYRLSDGTIFEIRLILTDIWLGEPDRAGDPLYKYIFGSVGRISKIKESKIMS